MISELTFSRKFTSYWNQLLPNANNFIRIVNGSLIDDVYPPLMKMGKRKIMFLLMSVVLICMLQYITILLASNYFCRMIFFTPQNSREL